MKKLLVMASMMAMTAHGANVEDLERKVNVLAEEIESLKSNPSTSDKLSIGGYAEIIFEDYSSENEAGAAVGSRPGAQWDTLRNVVYIGYKFSDKWSVATEIEVEHANEVFTEALEVKYNDSELFNFKAGLVLTPMGYINEMHEPPTFIGVKRPELAGSIIPSTWRQNGLGIYGKKNALSYKLFLLNSMNSDNFNEGSVRSGRQKGSKAKGGKLSTLLRLDYEIMNGFEFGASAYVGKTNGLDTQGYKHNIYEAHTQLHKGGFRIRAVYAMSDIDGAKISAISSKTVADKQKGYYVDLSYDVTCPLTGSKLRPYTRYEALNLFDDVSGTVTADKSKDMTNMTFGLAVYPVDNLTFKVDYLKKSNETDTGVDQFNIGMGWQY